MIEYVGLNYDRIRGNVPLNIPGTDKFVANSGRIYSIFKCKKKLFEELCKKAHHVYGKSIKIWTHKNGKAISFSNFDLSKKEWTISEHPIS